VKSFEEVIVLEKRALEPVGCRYSISCGAGKFVLVDEAAEEVAAVHCGGVGRGIASCDRRVDRVRGS